VAGSSFLLDTNILVYAVRDDAPEQEQALAWLKDALDEGADVVATGDTLAGVVRIASHPRIVNRPDARAAIEFCDGLLQAGLSLVGPTGSFWATFRALCLRHGLSGNDVPDAHLAAVAIAHDATLVTHDRGFERFAELRLLDPVTVGDGW